MTFEEAVEKVEAEGFQWMVARDDRGLYLAGVFKGKFSTGPDAEGAATPAHALLAALECHK